MKKRRETSDIDPLKPEEAAGALREYCLEVVTNIPRFIRRMGLSKSLGRTIEKLKSFGCHLPTFEQIRLVLVQDLILQTQIYERVEKDFRTSVAKGQVDRNHVGGWLNRTTERKTWRLAESKAKRVIWELSAIAGGTDDLANIGSTDYLPDELLASREVAERFAEIVATLSIEDKQLFDAKIAGRGYEELAIARGKTPNAIKTEASRLWKC